MLKSKVKKDQKKYPKIKLCGFSEIDSLEVAIAFKCDFLGFIFYEKSIRNISLSKAKELFLKVPESISKVAVVVDPEVDFLNQISALNPQYIQFHGSESPEFITDFKNKNPHIKIIKAFRVETKSDLDNVKDYELVADLFLFDSKVTGEMGGSGKKFDWSILNNLDINKDWFLSGGLNINNIDEAIKESGANIIDISSGIEEKKGIKSSHKIQQLINSLNSASSIQNSK